jgi:hypothetical protein
LLRERLEVVASIAIAAIRLPDVKWRVGENELELSKRWNNRSAVPAKYGCTHLFFTSQLMIQTNNKTLAEIAAFKRLFVPR